MEQVYSPNQEQRDQHKEHKILHVLNAENSLSNQLISFLPRITILLWWLKHI